MTINEIQNGQVCEKLISKFSVWSLETLERLHDDCFTFELPADEVHTDMMKHLNVWIERRQLEAETGWSYIFTEERKIDLMLSNFADEFNTHAKGGI